MSLQLLAGPALVLGLTLAIVAPARAEEPRAEPRIDVSPALARHALDQAALVRQALQKRGATRALAPNPVQTHEPTKASTPGLFSIDFAQLRKVVADLAEEAVTGLKSAAIHLPFEMRVTPESAVSWVKGLFGCDDTEPVRGDEAASASKLRTVSFADTAPLAATEPLFIPADRIDQLVRAVAVLRLDQERGLGELRALSCPGSESDVSRSSFEFRMPSPAKAEAEEQGGWLCRVLCTG